ncbi:MAG: hypothetical protein OXR72_05500 [Gemmatimonadota bacterium]|nr:hypothetical protein [Gemmatimonadota bacterium]
MWSDTVQETGATPSSIFVREQMITRGVVVFALITIAPIVCAESDISANMDPYDRKIYDFQLNTKCRGVNLVVEQLSDDARKMGLQKKKIVTAVESRLRSANLYDPNPYGSPEGHYTPKPYLYVNINVVGPAFSARLELTKYINDPLSGRSGSAATWKQGSLGTHGNRSDYIVSAVRELMDHFVNEWYKVNKPDGKCVE